MKLRIRDLRKERGISQTTFAEIFDVSQRVVSMWETGERIPRFESIVAIADYFDVSIDYLVGRSDVRAIARTPNVVPYPDTIAAHDSENAEEIDVERMKEIIIDTYNLIMKSELNKK